MSKTQRYFRNLVAALAAVLTTGIWASAGANAQAGGLVETIKIIKPSIVGIGTFDALRRPAINLRGTGFIVGDGHYVATNYHVVKPDSGFNGSGSLSVFLGSASDVEVRRAEIVGRDETHDIALLKFSGAPGPALPLVAAGEVEEGQVVAFTGFPLGTVYGFYPVTHRGILSAITPIVIPQVSPRQLSAQMIRRLKGKFNVYQLDATAYPGNSGSPVYDPATGRVLALVSSVFVKQTKEKVLSEPSGITFAIPVSYLKNLMAQEDLLGDKAAKRHTDPSGQPQED